MRPQTSICAEIDDGTDLHELLELCSGLGLRLISVRRLTSISAKHDEDVHGHIEPGGLAASCRRFDHRLTCDPDSSPRVGPPSPAGQVGRAVGARNVARHP